MAIPHHASTEYITVNGIQLAYRRLGQATGIPLVLLVHFRGTMDFWDPALLTRLSDARALILIDYAGVGRSGGDVAPTIAGWAEPVIALLGALGYRDENPVDVLGFSMGGATAQMVALNAPGLVRRLVLAGTSASAGGENELVLAEPGPAQILTVAMADAEVEAAMAATFYTGDGRGREEAGASWRRIREGCCEDWRGILSAEGTARQVEAIRHWRAWNPDNSYDRLGELKIPVFVANGDADVLIPTVNSWSLVERIDDAHLHIYPHAGHGFLFQYAELFATHVNLFLDGPGSGS